MIVNFKDFSQNVPYKQWYEECIDYLHHSFDLEFEDAFYLVQHLKREHSSVCIIASEAIVDFIIFNNALTVQIDGLSTWFGENLDLDVAKEILRVAWDGCEDFGSQIPGTDREWDVHFS